jgi:hypothetical protein
VYLQAVSFLSPARVGLFVLLGSLALRADDCSNTADGLEMLGANLALIFFFLLGVPLGIAQATTVAVGLTRPRLQGNVAFGLSTLWAVTATVGAIVSMAAVADVSARLRHKLTQSLALVLIEAGLIVGAWFLFLYKRFGTSSVPTLEGQIPMSASPVRAIIIGSAVTCVAALVLGYLMFIAR